MNAESNRLTRGFNLNTGISCRFDDFEDEVTESCRDEEQSSTDNETSNQQALQLFQLNIPSHLLIVALLERICMLYDPKDCHSRELFQVLCSQLSAMKLIPPFALLDEFQSIRTNYRIALDDLMGLAINTIQQQKTSSRIERPLPWNESPSTAMPHEKPHLIRAPSRYKEEFEEIEALGEGGFGCVFEARHKLDGRRYAIKKIKLGKVHPDDCLKSLREVKVLANLENANVVQYYSAWLEYSIGENKRGNRSKRFEDPNERSTRQTFLGSKASESNSTSFIHFSDESSTSTESFVGDPEGSAFSQLGIISRHKIEDASDKSVADDCYENIYEHEDDHCNSGATATSFIRGHFSGQRSAINENQTSERRGHVMLRKASSFHSNRIFRRVANPLRGFNQMMLMEEQLRTIEIAMHIQMELCSSTLKHWINERNDGIFNNGSSIELSVIMNIFKQLLLGVNYIHTKGIMHRDLKPSNVFLSADNESGEITLKIGDFGLARTVKSSSGILVSHRRSSFQDYIDGKDEDSATKGIGTCIYAAPEQISTDSYTSKADVYSLGIILLELFLPFKTAMERHSMLRELRSSSLPETVIGKWPDMREIIKQMTDLDPNNRPTVSSLLNISYFRNKDKVMELLRLELADKTKQIKLLNEMLQEKDSELEELRKTLRSQKLHTQNI